MVDRATAGPAYPRYERLALQLIGINEFVLLTEAPAGLCYVRDGQLAAPHGVETPPRDRGAPDGRHDRAQARANVTSDRTKAA